MNNRYIQLKDGRLIKVASQFSQKACSLINAYNSMKTDSTIYTCYAKPSKEKVSAYENIKREAYDNNGYSVRTGRANTYNFSMGYKINCDDGLTYLIYHTATRTQAACIGAYN